MRTLKTVAGVIAAPAALLALGMLFVSGLVVAVAWSLLGEEA